MRDRGKQVYHNKSPPRPLMLKYIKSKDWKLQLISLYCWIEDGFEKRGWNGLCVRCSNNQHLEFTDAEVMTMYLYARIRGYHKIKQGLEFIRDFMPEFFPGMPRYSAYVDRIHRLKPALIAGLEEMTTRSIQGDAEYLIDSCPVPMAGAKRSSRARVAPQLATVGYCASKSMWYYGIKLHAIARRRPGQLPMPAFFAISGANVHDSKALAAIAPALPKSCLYADLAYDSDDLRAALSAVDCTLFVPRKRIKGRFHFPGPCALSKQVSALRQPVESLFSWLQIKTHFQYASHIRSEKGLQTFIWSSLLTALVIGFPSF